jgi:hypothetical protein
VDEVVVSHRFELHAFLFFGALLGCAAPDGPAQAPEGAPDVGAQDASRGGEVLDAAAAVDAGRGRPDTSRDGGGDQPDAPAPADAGAPPPPDMGTTPADAGGGPASGQCSGYATRYWDCCKAHCGWDGNVPDGVSPVTSCDASDQPLASFDVASSCGATGPSSAYTCNDMSPWSVSATLSYGYAAVPAEGDICGRCYELEFDGSSYNAGADPGSAALLGKKMIVQATNIGHDVAGRQFDILIPGGGVGLFDACTYQWGVDTSELGEVYGGFLAACKKDANYQGSHDSYKQCVRSRCEGVFDEPEHVELRDACVWFVDWFEAADNPSLKYREVECPQAIVDASGVDRRPLDDVSACEGGGGGSPGGSGGACDGQDPAACDCSWAQGGAACGDDDGSCCWTACCG